MQYGELIDFLQHVGKDPSRLIFEDELTGIHNRRFLLSYLEHKVLWDSRDGFPLSLLIIDLDRFKNINDTHGHEAGDQVLSWLATLLKDAAGDAGLPIRYGGDDAEIVETLRDPELVVACCQTLGQIGNPAGIDALGTILAEKRFGFLGFRWEDQVRATAALALRQIVDPSAAVILQPFMEDHDARIRQLSRGANAQSAEEGMARA